MAGYIGSKASVVSSGAERKKTFTITGATTSLTGLDYTVGKVNVFQNGVRLVDGTDYTATNGTTITLTVAAQSGDNVVVISQAAFQVADALLTSGGTMTGDLTVQGAFTSVGIDDNADAVALTIDSSENVMVGVASVQTQSGTTAGTSLYGGSNAGLITAGRNGDVLRLNRQSTDGDIAVFKKDGSTVGYVGTYGGDLTVGTGDTGVRFIDSLDTIVPISDSAGTSRDAAIDLGYSSIRYKDLYLSGGTYLGGVAAANKLDDYEEGTWTPILTRSSSNPTSGGYTNQLGTYTKVGNKVFVSCLLNMSSWSGGSGWYRVGGLPFTISSSNAISQISTSDYGNYSLSNGTTAVGGYFSPTNTFIALLGHGGGAAANVNYFSPASNFYIYLSGAYLV